MNNTTKATGRFSIHCAQSSDDDLDFLYYSNRCNGIKGRSGNGNGNGISYCSRNHNSNPLSVNVKTKSVSPFEPLAKDRNYDGINGGGKISPLPQNEYEIWATKRKRDVQTFRPPSFHHSHFRPVVLSQNDKEVGNEGNGEVPMSSSNSNCNSVTYQGEGHNNREQIMSLESVEKLKLENEYLQKKVEQLERLLHHHQQQQQQHHEQNSRRQGESPIAFFNHASTLEPMSKDQHNDVLVSKR